MEWNDFITNLIRALNIIHTVEGKNGKKIQDLIPDTVKENGWSSRLHKILDKTDLVVEWQDRAVLTKLRQGGHLIVYSALSVDWFINYLLPKIENSVRMWTNFRTVNSKLVAACFIEQKIELPELRLSVFDTTVEEDEIIFEDD